MFKVIVTEGANYKGMTLSLPIMTRITSCSIVFLILLCFLAVPAIPNPDTWAQTKYMSEHVDENHVGGMNGDQEGLIQQLIPSITEWTGVFSLGVFSGLVVFNTNASRNDDNQDFETKTRRRNTTISIATLSISIGIIHVLLVPEHSSESLAWGVTFLLSGLAQLGFGVIILFTKKPFLRTVLYYIGIIGNAVLAITFILVRLITPPFSPEGIPINELEPNGIITLIIEILLVILLAYQLKHKDETKEGIKQI